MDENAKYIAILKKIPGQPLEELTVIRKDSFITKLNYVLASYDRELNNKFTEGVRIIAFTQADSLGEIENRLFG